MQTSLVEIGLSDLPNIVGASGRPDRGPLGSGITELSLNTKSSALILLDPKEFQILYQTLAVFDVYKLSYVEKKHACGDNRLYFA